MGKKIMGTVEAKFCAPAACMIRLSDHAGTKLSRRLCILAGRRRFRGNLLDVRNFLAGISWGARLADQGRRTDSFGPQSMSINRRAN